MSQPDNRELRLTLRTLLAWLDDQLSPADVRQIGQKVSESAVARGLIAKIQKVGRRRRLTVPTASGPDGTDPNLVASYLDNELANEAVTAYEEKCLRSDVDLAEAASCHQILSMISQRAKVPPEARFRMYRLVKGREAISREPEWSASTAPPEPAAKPIPQWTPPGGARRRTFIERFGPPAAAVLLMGLMGISAWMMIPDASELSVAVPPAAVVDEAEPVGPAAGADVPRPGVDPARADLAGVEPEDAEEDSSSPVEPDEDATAAINREPGASPVAAAVGNVADLADGVLLRWDPAARAWGLLNQDDAFQRGDRLAAPGPFSPTLKLGMASVRLVGPAVIEVGQPAADEAARLNLIDGRVVLHESRGGLVAVEVDSQVLRLVLPAEVPVGLERVKNWPTGAEVPMDPSLIIQAPGGQVSLQADNVAETLSGPGSVVLRLPTEFTDATSGRVDAWVTGEPLEDADLLTAQRFASYFTPELTTTRALVEALEDDTAGVRQIAVSTLGLVGAVDLVVGALTRSGDPAMRLAAIRALRDYGATSPAAARDLLQRLVSFNGEDWGSLAFRLIAGTPPEAARQLQTYVDLVGLLEHRDLGIRTLALHELMRLTRRDSLQYDPDIPTGPGLNAWRSLLESREIVPGEALEDETAPDTATQEPPAEP